MFPDQPARRWIGYLCTENRGEELRRGRLGGQCPRGKRWRGGAALSGRGCYSRFGRAGSYRHTEQGYQYRAAATHSHKVKEIVMSFLVNLIGLIILHGTQVATAVNLAPGAIKFV